MTRRTYLISAWIRIWHWTNALLVLVLGVTGMSLHFADPKLPLVEFSLAVRIHNIAGVTLIAAYAGYFARKLDRWFLDPATPPLQRLRRRRRLRARLPTPKPRLKKPVAKAPTM